MMSKVLPLETSQMRPELRSPRSSAQRKVIPLLRLHQNSLDYEMYQSEYTSKWSWYLDHECRNSKWIKEVHTSVSKRLKLFQKLHIYCCIKSLKDLRHSRKGVVTLKYLRLRISDFSSLQAEATGLEKLIELIEKLGRLENFKLLFYVWSWGTDNDLNNLSKSFTRHNSLKTLFLHFWESPKITDLGICYLCRNIKHLTLLENISIKLYKCAFITDNALITMKTFLGTLKKLQTVELSFKSCPNISLAAIEDIIQGFGASKISTHFGFWEITVKSSTKEPKRFISFDTDFWEKDQMNECKNLERLILKLAISQDLSLKFAGGSSLRQICQTLKALPFLNGLSFKFSDNAYLCDEDFKKIGNSTKHLRHLKHISFELREQSFLGEKELRYLYEIFENFHSLETLNLGFSECYLFKIDGLKVLSGSLRKMVSLQKLSLDFFRCNKITDLWLENIVQNLEELGNLQEFTLRFTPNKKITRVGHEKIIEILKSHQSLQRVHIDYGEDFPKVEFENDLVVGKQLLQKRKVRKLGLLNFFGTSVMHCLKKKSKKGVKDDSPLFLPQERRERDCSPIYLT